MLRRRHREGRIEHKDSTSISDHRGDCIGTMRKETQGDKAWKEDKLLELQRLKAKKMCEMNCDLKSTSEVVSCIRSKALNCYSLTIVSVEEKSYGLRLA